MSRNAEGSGQIKPAKAWLYADIPSAVSIYDDERRAALEDFLLEPGDQYKKSNKEVQQEEEKKILATVDPPMMWLRPSPEAMLATTVESKQRVIQVAVGAEHGVLLTDAGIAFTFGDNRYGQLGRAACLKEEDKRPFPVTDLLHEEVLQVAAGTHHCLALMSKGMVWAWGRNKNGQCGNGTTKDQIRPVLVALDPTKQTRRRNQEQDPLGGTPETRIITIGAGGMSSVASGIDSSVWQWGAISSNFTNPVDPPLDGSPTKASESQGTPVVRTHPYRVFTKKQFIRKVRKGTGLTLPGTKPAHVHVSVSATGCRVLPEAGDESLAAANAAKAREERLRDIIMTARQHQEEIAKERLAVAAEKEKRKAAEEADAAAAASANSVGGRRAGAGGEGAVKHEPETELRKLEETVAILKRDIAVASRQSEALEMNLQNTTMQLDSVKEQLNGAIQQATLLNEKMDTCALSMLNQQKGSKERQYHEEKLAEIRRYVESTESTRKTLEKQKNSFQEEKKRLRGELDQKNQFKDEKEKKLRLVEKLKNKLESDTGTSSKVFHFLKELNDKIRSHFAAGRPTKSDNFTFAMEELETDRKFLDDIDNSARQLEELANSDIDEANIARARLACDLLRDLIKVRRDWLNLLEDQWVKKDLDLSCFFPKEDQEKGSKGKPSDAR